MRSPADMEFIQIDITNACNLRCSNCTRFCGNHEKPFFMDFDTFRRAVDSLDGFDGVTGLIGGEPTLHPEFERLAGYMREKFGQPAQARDAAGWEKDPLLYPQGDFIHAIHQREFDSCMLREREDGSRFVKKHGAGLWSNMGATYRKYYETIQDTFSVQYLNDHLNPSWHQPGLFSRKDLGIPDEEWVPMRDKCWIQNTWSASVTPKGAFFCEVAGALDMLFGGPGGWPIEAGWWKRKPSEFGDQLHWCEICGFALEGRTFTRDSQEEIDDVSPTLYEMLKKTGSPKLKAGKINPVKIVDGVIAEESRKEDKRFVVGGRYIAQYADRFQEKNSVLFQMSYQERAIQAGGDFGKLLNQEIHGNGTGRPALNAGEWLLLKQDESIGAGDIKEMAGKRIFNPGSLHLGEGYVFFCKAALSLRRIGFDRIARMSSADELIKAWEQDRVVHLRDTERMADLSRPAIERGKKYAIWGAGMLGEFFAEAVRLSGGTVSIIVDRARDRIGMPFAGMTISSPEALLQRAGDFDWMLVAHHLCFEDIEKEATDMGIPEEKIRLPFEV